MKAKSIFASGIAFAIMALAFVFVSLPVGPVYATITTTVTGWLFPDGAHWNNGIGAVLYPFVGVGLFAAMAMITESESDFGVTLILAGFTVGGILATLSINASNTNVLPFALVLIPASDLIIWMWRGGG